MSRVKISIKYVLISMFLMTAYMILDNGNTEMSSSLKRNLITKKEKDDLCNTSQISSLVGSSIGNFVEYLGNESNSVMNSTSFYKFGVDKNASVTLKIIY